MIGFLIKKTFFDTWDNLFRLALINLGFLASGAFVVYIPPLLEGIPALSITLFVIGVLWGCVYLAAAALSLKAVSDYGAFDFAGFFANIKIAWPIGLVAGGILLFLVLLVTVVMSAYLSMESMIGLGLAAAVFWTLVVAVLSFQYLFPIRARLDTKISKVLKKCLIFFFDNPLFCIFSGLYSLICLIISIIPAFLFPGPAGVLLFLDEALRLRLLKYDWLEENPGADRRRIPWDALLIDEREKTGSRSLRNLIFPWKD